MEEKHKKLLRYVELAARDTRSGCDDECQKEKAKILVALRLSHEEAVKAGQELVERLS